VTDQPIAQDTTISLSIKRSSHEVFSGTVCIDQIRRSFEELAGFLYRECSFPHGSFLMTGTGIVPGSDFTLQSGDEIVIGIDGIGVLTNTVA
jgi:2-dehydro-3-deoxy-D-arabinonate dehydratase